jgi:hypothetical protein
MGCTNQAEITRPLSSPLDPEPSTVAKPGCCLAQVDRQLPRVEVGIRDQAAADRGLGNQYRQAQAGGLPAGVRPPVPSFSAPRRGLCPVGRRVQVQTRVPDLSPPHGRRQRGRLQQRPSGCLHIAARP